MGKHTRVNLELSATSAPCCLCSDSGGHSNDVLAASLNRYRTHRTLSHSCARTTPHRPFALGARSGGTWSHLCHYIAPFVSQDTCRGQCCVGDQRHQDDRRRACLQVSCDNIIVCLREHTSEKTNQICSYQAGAVPSGGSCPNGASYRYRLVLRRPALAIDTSCKN